MIIFLYILIYACILIFIAACLIRALQYARTPIHLRWELYPVPHEDPARLKHGGSYFEEKDWWTRSLDFNLWSELKSMLLEILFLKGLWEFNRKLWFRSFPFHFGLYLLIGTAGLMAFCTALFLISPALMTGIFGNGLQLLYTFTGTTGLALSILGALGLLVRRLLDEDLKTYTTPGDIFNLLFFIFAFGILALGCILPSSAAPDMLTISRGLLTFDTSLELPGLLSAGLILTGLLVAYIPLTHMSHFIAKYFTYHSVRWDDSPNRRGERLEARLAEYLTYRPTWAAAHIGADGKKTWVEIATTNPAEVKK